MRRRTFLGATLAVVASAISVASLGLRAAAAQVVSALERRRRGMLLPPIPKWNNQTDDIDSIDFARQVRDSDWSLLPPGTIIPREGQIWEAVRDCKMRVWARVAHSGPQLSKLQHPNGQVVAGYQPVPASALKLFLVPEARLRKGERVRVLATDPKPTSVTLEPLRYDELHDSIVPREFRALGYEGYRLIVATARPKWCPDAQTACLNGDFRLVEDVA